MERYSNRKCVRSLDSFTYLRVACEEALSAQRLPRGIVRRLISIFIMGHLLTLHKSSLTPIPIVGVVHLESLDYSL